MGIVLVPIKADKIKIWKGFIEELNGSRKADFADFNKRFKLTKHEAWICETPAGAFVCAIQISETSGLDVSKPPPGKVPERKLSWTA
jgi:hypothetical protein